MNKREGYAFAFETPGRFKQVAKADKTGTGWYIFIYIICIYIYISNT